LPKNAGRSPATVAVRLGAGCVLSPARVDAGATKVTAVRAMQLNVTAECRTLTIVGTFDAWVNGRCCGCAGRR
jgi:hypothetical protein